VTSLALTMAIVVVILYLAKCREDGSKQEKHCQGCVFDRLFRRRLTAVTRLH
jgi:hypothetical protein